jgi:hypothetical protein
MVWFCANAGLAISVSPTRLPILGHDGNPSMIAALALERPARAFQ